MIAGRPISSGDLVLDGWLDALHRKAYRSGEWTCALTFETPGDLSVAYSQQTGYWVRIFDLAIVWFTVLTSSFTHSTASGRIQVTGCPFTTKNLGTQSQVRGLVSWAGVTKANYTDMASVINSNENVIEFQMFGSGQARSNVESADVPTGGTVFLKGTIIFEAQS